MLPGLLTPKQAAKLLGVSESTVRRWCDGDLLAFSKTTGGHRRIERAVLLEFARGQGLAIVEEPAIATAGRGGRLPNKKELAERFYESIVSGDARGSMQFLLTIVERIGDAASVCDDVIAPAMHRVGENWESGEIRVYREHLATEATTAALAAARSSTKTLEEAAPTAVCAALSGDPYSLAPAMSALVLASLGFKIALLGARTPGDEIVAAAKSHSATLIAVSVSTSPESPDELAALCRAATGAGIHIALGGQELTTELRKAVEPDFFGDTMAHLASYARRLRD